MKKPAFLLLPLLFIFFSFSFENDWKLVVDKEGIKIYTKKEEGAKVLATRVVMDLSMSVEEVRSRVMDVGNHKDWMNTVVTSDLLRKEDNGIMVSYYVADVPWPVTDRDIVLIWESSKEGNMTVIKSKQITGEKPEVDGKVRVPYQDNYYKLTPLPNGGCHFDYVGKADPGGSLPSWLANMFVTDVPFKTWKKFKEKFEK